MYESNLVVNQGGLMSYGPTGEDMFRRAVAYIHRIFKGAKPADLPAEQPVKYQLTVNPKTAEMLGLTLPQSILLRAEVVVP